jgi:hypothetical protein
MRGPIFGGLALLVGLASGCSKGAASDGGGPAGSAVGASPGAAGPAGALPSTSTSTSTSTTVSVNWTGGYKSAATGITLPTGVGWKVPESTAGVGEGTIAMTVDAGGRVTGTVDGVLGPAMIDGLAVDGRVTGAIVRRDPSDHGFTGTLSGELAAGHAHGTMNLTLAEASAVRTASFDLSPAAAAGPKP